MLRRLVLSDRKIVIESVFFLEPFQKLDLIRIIDRKALGLSVITRNAYNNKAILAKILLPLFKRRKSLETRRAPCCPKIKQNHLSAKTCKRHFCARQPLVDTFEFGRRLAHQLVLLFTFF